MKSGLNYGCALQAAASARTQVTRESRIKQILFTKCRPLLLQNIYRLPKEMTSTGHHIGLDVLEYRSRRNVYNIQSYNIQIRSNRDAGSLYKFVQGREGRG